MIDLIQNNHQFSYICVLYVGDTDKTFSVLYIVSNHVNVLGSIVMDVATLLIVKFTALHLSLSSSLCCAVIIPVSCTESRKLTHKDQ